MSQSPVSIHDKLLLARSAASCLALLPSAKKNAILLAIADQLENNADNILVANRSDIRRSGLSGPMLDRLSLNPERISGMSASVREIAGLQDPVGDVIADWTRPNGLRIRKIRVPLGVIGMIFEARPNVTVDSAALAVKAGNAIILRGGKEAAETNACLVRIIAGVPDLPRGAIELLDSTNRNGTEELIRARGLVDVIIPRGGPDLISYVTENAVVPVIETGAGNCHIFVDASADFDMADRIIINAKTQRPSVCNAAEKLLVHEQIAAEYLPRIVRKLRDWGVELRGDVKSLQLLPDFEVRAAGMQDWSEEYLELCMAVRVVANLDEAIAHINRYSTRHSESIITSSEINAHKFLQSIDSAAVYWNASTRFTDGGEFGFGAEMGISTQKLHCRGPFALTELTSMKYEIIGTGQIRA